MYIHCQPLAFLRKKSQILSLESNLNEQRQVRRPTFTFTLLNDSCAKKIQSNSFKKKRQTPSAKATDRGRMRRQKRIVGDLIGAVLASVETFALWRLLFQCVDQAALRIGDVLHRPPG